MLIVSSSPGFGLFVFLLQAVLHNFSLGHFQPSSAAGELLKQVSIKPGLYTVEVDQLAFDYSYM
jgi:hypothetical protein